MSRTVILIKRSFAFEELQEIRLVKNKHPALSVADCSCVYLSTRLSATLLTGDAVLRRAAKWKTVFRYHGLFCRF